MRTNLFTDLNETQSEAINGGFLDFTSNKRLRIRVNQESGSAVVGVFALGPVSLNSGNTSNITATVS
jgi:hypothetical protein